MGKALVLSDVDFSAVALDTVTIVAEPIDCTGITLDQSTLSITSFDTVTLTATVTPADTTDSITWSSSDTSVCTVSNGVITPMASGTATITATCGDYSATCAVTLAIEVDLTATATLTLGYIVTIQSDVASIATNNGAGASVITTGEGYYAYGSSTALGDDKAYPIDIPTGCTEIQVTVPNQNYKATFVFVDKTQHGTTGMNYILLVSGDSTPWTGSVANGDRTVTVPDGANAFYLTIFPRNSATIAQTDLDEVTVKAIC